MQHSVHFHQCVSRNVEECWCADIRYGLLIVITSAIFLVEWKGSEYSGSTALWGDAWHVLGDNLPFIVGFASLIAARCGYNPYKVERGGAWLNALLLVVVALVVLYRGIEHLLHPESLSAPWIAIGIAIGGAAGNVLQRVVLGPLAAAHRHGHLHKSQMRHVVSDFLSSVAVIVGAFAYLMFGWIWADGAATLVVGFVIAKLALDLTRDIAHE